jgi:RNA polymerase sigma-70 factor (ECF subfamily)
MPNISYVFSITYGCPRPGKRTLKRTPTKDSRVIRYSVLLPKLVVVEPLPGNRISTRVRIISHKTANIPTLMETPYTDRRAWRPHHMAFSALSSEFWNFFLARNELDTGMNELELLEKIFQGDENAFIELYNNWHSPVFRFAWQMTGTKSLAEEVAQDVFLLLIRKQAKFCPERGNFSSFIYGLARNLSLRAVRKNRRYQGILNLFGKQPLEQTINRNPLSDLSDEETTSALRRCILSLPPRYREILVLCDLHELSYAEAASITNTAVGTVRSRLHRAREILAAKMRPASEMKKQKKGGTPYELPAL